MALPENFVSRGELDWPATGADYASPDQGLVIHYDSSDQGLADKPHSACVTYWNNTRSFHMGPSRGWADVGYSFFCCPHDYILEGRGIDRQQAAQQGGNATHYSATLATGPDESIPPAQINAVRRLREWLIEDHNNHGRVLGHRDFNSTSCPGDKAYTLVTNGTFAQAPGAVLEGDDMSIEGLTHGDGKSNGKGRAVRILQLMLTRIGNHNNVDLLPEYGADQDYGDEVAKAVLWVRKELHESSATNGNTITSYAFDQIWVSYIQSAEANTVVIAELPDDEEITITGTLSRG